MFKTCNFNICLVYYKPMKIGERFVYTGSPFAEFQAQVRRDQRNYGTLSHNEYLDKTALIHSTQDALPNDQAERARNTYRNEAYTSIYRSLTPLMVVAIRRFTPNGIKWEEVVGEAWNEVRRSINKYKPEKGPLPYYVWSNLKKMLKSPRTYENPKIPIPVSYLYQQLVFLGER